MDITQFLQCVSFSTPKAIESAVAQLHLAATSKDVVANLYFRSYSTLHPVERESEQAQPWHVSAAARQPWSILRKLDQWACGNRVRTHNEHTFLFTSPLLEPSMALWEHSGSASCVCLCNVHDSWVCRQTSDSRLCRTGRANLPI
jgi:hypothetical protein